MQNRLPPMKGSPDHQATCRRREPLDGQLQLPPGFRFYPSDEELVVHYLCKHASSQPCFPTPIIAALDLYKFDPWELPGKALFGEREWYFFSPRDRKYPNGSRPNRAAGSGYWKATGTDKPVLSSLGDGSKKKVGVKKALVFYRGRPPRGDKTNWIMHEYRLADSAAKAAKHKGSIRLDDWVLCRIYNKLPSTARLAMQKDDEKQHEFEAKAVVENERKTGMRYTTSPLLLEDIQPNSTNVSLFNNHVPSHQTQSHNVLQQPSKTETTMSEIPFIRPPHAARSLGVKDPYMTSTSFDQSSVTSSLYAKPIGSSCLERTSPKIQRPSNTPNTVGQQFSHPHMIPTTNKLDAISNKTFERIPFLKALNIPNPIRATHDSPISSSVDEEEGQPVQNRQGQITYKDPRESMTSFNFDVLPSLFGQVDLRFSF